MDARSENAAIPLAVDLDGTLIKTDLLWEGLFRLLKKNPLYLLIVPVWLASGPARLKLEIAARVDLDAGLLPYREEVVSRLRAEKATGRPILLATGTPRKFAEAIAAHLGVFDAVIATDDPGHNFTSERKRARLMQMFGDGGFDYVGNSRHDLKVFDAARASIVVAPDRRAARWQVEHDCELIPGTRPTAKAVLRMLRAHQWLKNSLIAVPVVLAHEYLDPAMIVACVLAIVSFSAAASAIYIVNDFTDLSADRRHATKRRRPFASGDLTIPFGIVSIGVLLAVSFAAAAFLPPLFWLVLVGYLVATTAYSFGLKRMLLIDVFTLAGLYTMRIIAGAMATGTDVSFWLLAFSIFFFLSLALVKRFVELDGTEISRGARLAGRGYRPEDIDIVAQSGVASAFASALVLALYIDSMSVKELYPHPWMIWPLAPIVLYLTLRIWVLARRGEMHDDPIVFIASDWRSQMVSALGVILLVLAAVQA